MIIDDAHKAFLERSDKKVGGQQGMISHIGLSVFNWMNLIVSSNMPFSVVTDPMVRTFAKPSGIALQ